jgi:hypothetical protein
MNYDEYMARREWLMDVYGFTRDEAKDTALYDRDPETWVGSEWEQ